MIKVFFLAALLPMLSYSQTHGVRQTHPMAIQHQLPVGESPGWLTKNWVEFEFTNGNHWAEPTRYNDIRNGNRLVWNADFEQATFWLEAGRQLRDNLAFSIEAPFYAMHEGSDTDHFIDEFHKIFGFSRFGRQRHNEGQINNETQVIKPDGTITYKDMNNNGIGNIKIKLKYWAVKMERDTGAGASFHAKIPIGEKTTGRTSGDYDYTGLLHFGVPIGQRSGFYLSGGGTYLGENWMFKEWPRNRWIWMMDYHFNIAFAQNWAIVLNFNFSGAFMKKKYLKYDQNLSSRGENPNFVELNASNYNSLANYRGNQTLGIKQLLTKNSYVMLFIQEDWGLGNKDNTGDLVYSHNQPDVALGFKSLIHF